MFEVVDTNKSRSGRVNYQDEDHVMSCEGRRPCERPRVQRGFQVGVVKTMLAEDTQQWRSWALGSYCHVGLRSGASFVVPIVLLNLQVLFCECHSVVHFAAQALSLVAFICPVLLLASFL